MIHRSRHLLKHVRSDIECGEIIRRRWWHRGDGKRAAASPEILAEISTLRKSGHTVGERTYTAAIEVLGRRKRPKHSELVFWGMIASGISPTDASYGALLRAFSNTNRYDRIAYIWSDMKSRGVQPNQDHYNTILGAFVSLGDPEAVSEILTEMKTHNIREPPNKSLLLVASQKTVHEAYKLAKELSLPLGGNEDAACALFKIAERTKNLPAALSLHSELASSCGSPVYYCVLLDVFISCGEYGRALRFFKSLPEEYLTSPSRGLYERLLIIHLLKKSNIFDFEFIVDHCLKVHADYSPFYALAISLYKQCGNQAKALQIDKLWQSRGVRPDQYLLQVSENILMPAIVDRPKQGGLGVFVE
eukprot:TRINITY_DN4270_c4_g1_i1.p1 TRINITY_DN4270_c4_g1~~TRINITY_DN4270_c4_g1_i1.p1  ORF type:complete len:361 (+),score=20.58 TRINITY_DN4270_c4_g1_i1:182-1264(+)